MHRFRRITIRTRIALAIFGAAAALLIAMSFAVYASFARALNENLDDTLRLRAAANLRLVDLAASPPTLQPGFDPGRERAEGDAALRLYGLDGSMLADASPATPVTPTERRAVASAGADGQVVSRDVALNGSQALRIRVTTVDRDGAPVALLVTGLERASVTEPLALLRLILLLSVPATAAAMALCAFFIARVALRPVARITEAAREIASGDLDRRLPPMGTRDEVSLLGETFNTMIERLAATIARERRFTADASHELRTPLAAIETSIDVTLSRERAEADYRATLESVRGQARRLARLTRQLLALARMDESRREVTFTTVDLAAIARTTSGAFAEAHPDARVQTDLPQGGAPLAADADLLAQALTNVLENAVVHAGPHVAVVVSLRSGPGLTTVVSIRDNGPGIRADLLPTVFERFRRGDASRTNGGTGLGLAIVEAIVRAHGGSARALAPGDGPGALIELSFPAVG